MVDTTQDKNDVKASPYMTVQCPESGHSKMWWAWNGQSELNTNTAWTERELVSSRSIAVTINYYNGGGYAHTQPGLPNCHKIALSLSLSLALPLALPSVVERVLTLSGPSVSLIGRKNNTD